MLSFTNATIDILLSPNPRSDLIPQACRLRFLDTNTRNAAKKKQERFLSLSFLARNGTGSVSMFVDLRKRNYREWYRGCGGFVKRCKKSGESEGDFALEAQILEFMQSSENPEVFPTKKQLIDAGRVDLAEAIVKQGGWLAAGWELHVDGIDSEEELDWYSRRDQECSSYGIQERAFEENGEASISYVGFDPSSTASSSGRSLEIAPEGVSGIEGILSRLEKERNANFGIGLRNRGSNSSMHSNALTHDWLGKTSKDMTVLALDRNDITASLNSGNGVIHNSKGKLDQERSLSNIDDLRNSQESDMRRSWSFQKAGFSEMEFEAGEIASCGTRTARQTDTSGDAIIETSEDGDSLTTGNVNSSYQSTNQNEVRSRIQQLELELSSVLQALKSKTCESVLQKDHGSPSDDFLKLSDAWEFQENEIMNTQHKLRSIRAKLAVLEGKMALAIINAQKVVEGKQKRIDDARRALQLLRTACIVWPNAASEVLLAGSFDGWATQRKMKKSRTGIFSLSLKLYPGRYEIKFIVDGEWRIDPLRPIVRNNGFENNLLIIT